MGKELRVKVLVFCRNGRWIAQCLDFDVVGEGDSYGQAKYELDRQFVAREAACIAFGVQRTVELTKAPQKYWDLWEAADPVANCALDPLVISMTGLTVFMDIRSAVIPAKKAALPISTPESDKMLAVRDEAKILGRFLQWLNEEEMYVAMYDYDCDDWGRLCHVGGSNEELLARYFKIDLAKAEEEKRALLATMGSGE